MTKSKITILYFDYDLNSFEFLILELDFFQQVPLSPEPVNILRTDFTEHAHAQLYILYFVTQPIEMLILFVLKI